MPTTPPDKIPTWGTDDLNNTVPGSAKQAAGWEVNEVPSSGHINWLFNQNGQMLEFLAEQIAPMAVVRNVKKEATSPFRSSCTATGVWYLPEFDKWYLYQWETTTSYWYESGDGGATWSAPWSPAASHSGNQLSRPVTDGSVLRIIAGNVVYESGTGSLANMVAHSTLPTSYAVYEHGFVYDSANSAWVAGCTVGGVDTGSARNVSGTTWNGTLLTVSHDIQSMDGDGAGRIIVSSRNDLGNVYYSTNGGSTYLLSTTPPHRFEYISWSEKLGLFLGINVSVGNNNELFVTLNGGTWWDTGLTCSNYIVSDEFVVCYGLQADSKSGVGYPVYLITGYNSAGDGNQLDILHVGEVGEKPFRNSPAEYRAGQGKIYYLAEATYDLHSAKWKP